MEINNKKYKMSPSLKIMLGFLIIILVGSLILCLPISNNNGEWLAFNDSIFTCTSAVCVTGLVVVDPAIQFTLFGQTIIMLLIQIGGLGIVSITTLIALILGKKINLSNRLTLQESMNKDSLEGVVAVLKKVILLTLSIELGGALLLLYSTITITGSVGYGIFTAIFMSISAFCNAGFDVLGQYGGEFGNLVPFAENVLLLLPIAFLIILGGIGFVVLFRAFKSTKGRQHIKVVLITTAILLVGGWVSFMLLEWNNPKTLGGLSTCGKIINAFFQSVTLRTAGFASIDQGGLTTGSQIISVILMFIGGSPNSTAGGLKTTTLVVLLVFLFSRPTEKGDIMFNKRRISAKVIRKAIKVFVAQLFALILSVLLISVIDGGIAINEIIFECTSAIATVGVSMGITTILSIPSQMILCLLMFVGRVGLMTIGLAVASSGTAAEFEYQNTDIIVG